MFKNTQKKDGIVDVYRFALIAQSAEQLPLKQTVPGSIPGGGTGYA